MLTASPAVRLYGGVPTRRASLAANWRRRKHYSAASAGAAGSSAGDEKGSPSPPPSAASAAVGPGTLQEIEELKQELQEAEEELQEERARLAALAPYLVSSPRREVVGSSRYAVRLRKDLAAAAKDPKRKPIIISGEPGLEKDNLAALVHFQSPDKDKPMVEALGDNATDLLYGSGDRKGLLHWLPAGATLLLNNVHKAAPAIQQLLRQVAANPEGLGAPTAPTAAGPAKDDTTTHAVRVIVTEEEPHPELEALCTLIKAPPLRVRASDIRPLAELFLGDFARVHGLGELRLSQEAVRQLKAYPFPLNIRELRIMVERAAAQAGAEHEQEIPRELFWQTTQPALRLRWDLLADYPVLRDFLRSPVWPDGIKFDFVAYAFAVVVAAGYLLPQDREHSFVLNMFWAWWWPGIFIVYPLLGRVWCAICPFMLYGELAQRLRLATGGKLRKWPTKAMERWGGWFLFSLFAAILVWEEVWDLPNTAYLSASLLLVITAGAVIGSWFFERRIWCRHLCPIGGMNGLFAKLAITELRARQGVCASECSTYTCYKGGSPVPPEGQESPGCPLYSHPAHLTDNKDCVLCMDCLKACPHRSIEFRVRPPGVDLWTTHVPSAPEACLMFMLLGAVYLHHLPQLMGQLGLDPQLAYSWKGPHILASAAVLALPGALCYGVDAVWRSVQSRPGAAAGGAVLAAAAAGAGAAAGGAVQQQQQQGGAAVARAVAVLRSSSNESASASDSDGEGSAASMAPQPFLDACYGYLPLVWGGTLAHYLDSLLNEAGRLLPVTAASFGLEAPWLPTFAAAPDIITFLQGTTLLAGLLFSVILTRKIGGGRYSWRQQSPQLALMLLLTAELWTLILPQPK